MWLFSWLGEIVEYGVQCFVVKGFYQEVVGVCVVICYYFVKIGFDDVIIDVGVFVVGNGMDELDEFQCVVYGGFNDDDLWQ